MTMINSSGQIILTVMILYVYIVTDTIIVIELSVIDCHQLIENAKGGRMLFILPKKDKGQFCP